MLTDAAAIDAGAPFLVTDLATAELVKVAANAFLATKISFINAMAEIAEVTGADVTQLADAIGHDVRIGRRFLGAGIGFGGGCLPKDIRAFSARAEELGRGESVAFLREVDEINLRRRDRAVQLVVDALGGQVFQKKVTVLGAAFKPYSDDIRDSPALDVAVRLYGLGAQVTVTDPEAIDNARRAHPQLTYVADRDEAIRDADALVLVTEWDEYRRELAPSHASTLTAGRVIVDGRNHYPQDLEFSAQEASTALRPGFVAAFAVPANQLPSVVFENAASGLKFDADDASEQLVIVAERGPGKKSDPQEIADTVRAAVAQRHGVMARDVLLVPAGSIPRTSSGKIARRATKTAYVDGRLRGGYKQDAFPDTV